jgi:dolichol-phosphate mannosyltransferase
MVKNICAVITALDEAATIGPLVRALRTQNMDVIVIDDGSADGTGPIARSWDAQVIRHETRQGIANSLLEAWRVGLSNSQHERFVQIDAGESHDPGEVARLLAVNADIVIGSRFCNGAEYIGNPRRAFFSKIAAAACNFARPKMRLTDWTSGYRVFTREALGKLACLTYGASGHAWQIEVLHKASRAGMTIGEAPITYRAGHSSLSAKSVDEAFAVWLELLLS